MYEEIHVVINLTKDIKIIKDRERVTSGRGMVVNSGRIIVVRCERALLSSGFVNNMPHHRGML